MSGLKGVILCGGKGTRLRPLTDEVPKPLVELAGKPCLQHILEGQIRRGLADFVLCIGYKGEMVREFVRRAGLDAAVEFSDAGLEASMLARLHAARDRMGERVSVSHGDTLIDLDLEGMLARHERSGAWITLTTAEVQSPFGLLTLDGDLIASYREKPVHPYFVGHMILERRVLDDLDPALLELPDGEGLVELFQRLIAERRLGGVPYDGPRVTFNTRQDLADAHREMGRFFTQDSGTEA